jgi:hypothetical protein
MSINLTNEEYDQRKQCLDELKKLVRSEQEQIFLILKKHKVEYSENSNGIFFDMCRVSNEAFTEIQKFLIFCQANRTEFEARDREISRLNLSDNQSLV